MNGDATGDGWAVYSAEEIDSWAKYFDRLDDAGAYHAPAYLRTLAGNFEPPEEAELFVLDPDYLNGFVYYPYLTRPLAALPFAEETNAELKSYRDIVSSWYYGGPIASVPEAATDLAGRFVEQFGETCAQRGIVTEFVRFDPNLKNHACFPGIEPTFNRETVPVDLTGGADAIWDGYEDRNRRAINQARETTLEVEATRDRSDVDAFHSIYTDAMDAKDAHAHYRFDAAYFHELVEDYPELASLLVVRYEDEVVGGFIAVHDDRTAHHFLSASIPDYWDMRVNNLLYHEVVMHFHDRGFTMFDFQGGRPGVFKFKKGFSPRRREFFVAKRTHMPAVYEQIVEAANRAGIDTDTDYFPAYRVEQSN